MASIPSNLSTCLAFLIASAPLAAAPQPTGFMPPAVQEPQTAHVEQTNTPASPAAPRVSYMYQLSPAQQGDLYMARRETSPPSEPTSTPSYRSPSLGQRSALLTTTSSPWMRP